MLLHVKMEPLPASWPLKGLNFAPPPFHLMSNIRGERGQSGRTRLTDGLQHAATNQHARFVAADVATACWGFEEGMRNPDSCSHMHDQLHHAGARYAASKGPRICSSISSLIVLQFWNHATVLDLASRVTEHVFRDD